MTPWSRQNERANALHLKALAAVEAVRWGKDATKELAAAILALRAELEGERDGGTP